MDEDGNKSELDLPSPRLGSEISLHEMVLAVQSDSILNCYLVRDHATCHTLGNSCKKDETMLANGVEYSYRGRGPDKVIDDMKTRTNVFYVVPKST